MGFFVNPPMDKQQWLFDNAHFANVEQSLAETFIGSDDFFPVCMVDNGAFFAAGVAYDRDEFTRMSRPDHRNPDHRNRMWFIVSKDKLYAVVDGLKKFVDKG